MNCVRSTERLVCLLSIQTQMPSILEHPAAVRPNLQVDLVTSGQVGAGPTMLSFQISATHFHFQPLTA